MCLIVFAWKSHADLPLVVAANRDELHARATEPAAFWEDLPQVCAGRDLVAGGTWLGITRGGRFAAVGTPAELLARYKKPNLEDVFLELTGKEWMEVEDEL